MINRKIILISALLAGITFIHANKAFDPVLAQVKLTKTKLIYLDNVEGKLELTKQEAGRELTEKEKDFILDSIINNELIIQAAERDGIKITEKKIITALKSQVPEGTTEEELKTAVERQYKQPWDEILKVLINQYTVQEYIKRTGADDLKKLASPPTESDIQDFYNKNQVKFINPDMVRVSHIFFKTADMTEEEIKETEAAAKKYLEDIKLGNDSFDDLAKLNGGDLGYISRDNSSYVNLLGDDFINTVFTLPFDGTPELYKSNAGYHIVKVTDKVDAKILRIDDPVDPSTKQTVKEFISFNLQQQKYNAAMNQITEKIVNALRSEALIKVIEKNIPWKK